ncbi:MAG: NADH-quinone oxidoreductase subunit NuoK [Myxococcales bacterium]|nr:NADH-quinone oxidoreductase subunit NuoK [Myxococcales bacterium]
MPIHYFLLLSAMLFTIGMLGVIFRRNALIVFMSIELMLNAVNLTLVTFSRFRGDSSGHVIAFLVMAVAAAEAAVGLAIIINIFRHKKVVNIDTMDRMKY